MRRQLSALVVAVLAAFLSLLLAVPANAADASPGGMPPKPMPTDPRFKYGLEYFYKELFDPNNPQGWKQLNVNETINPSKTGGSWYLNNQRNTRALPSGTANKPLVGKIITPGKTVVKPPSVYKPTAPFALPAGASGLTMSRLLGASGFGMGGVVEAPSNWKDIARTKVSAGCNVDTNAGCTSADFGQILSVTNCSQTATCVSLGAKDASGAPITSDANWFFDSAVPFLQDMWSMLTGQGQSKDAEIRSPGHIDVNPRGCYHTVTGFQPDSTGRAGQITSVSQTDTAAVPPSGTSSWAYWSTECSQPGSSAQMRGAWHATCQSATGAMTMSNSGTLGSTGSAPDWDTAGKARVYLCPDNYRLVQIRFYNPWSQTTFDGSPSMYSAMKYSEWITPDTNYDSTEIEKATTTVQCRVPSGEVYSYTKTIQKVAASPSPSCPVGSDLVGHSTSVNTGVANGSVPIDAGAEVAGTAQKYPSCTSGTGCALSIEVDGQPCNTSREDCRNWVAVASQTPSRVVCKWGTNVMPISDCYVIAEGYKTDIGVVLDPRSGSWTGVDSTGAPVPLSPAPWNPTNPNPVAGQSPTTGGSTGTTPSTGGFPSSGTNPSNACDSPSWSWNPVEWVHNPVVCALKDAFIPKTDVQSRSNELRDKALGTAPLGWAINPPMFGPGSGGGCPNWNIKVEGLSENVVCDSSFTAAIVGARGSMFGIVASAMMWPLLRSIWYALIPIVRVSPSGSK